MVMEDWSEDDLRDRYIEENGWKRKYGLIIKTEMINDEFPEWFFPEDMENEVLSRGFRWQHEDVEQVYEDCDILEGVEDIATVSFDEWKTKKFALHETKDDNNVKEVSE